MLTFKKYSCFTYCWANFFLAPFLCFVSWCFIPWDWIYNGALWCGNGCKRKRVARDWNHGVVLPQPIPSCGQKFYNWIAQVILCCAGSPRPLAWDYGPEPHNRTDPKRFGILGQGLGEQEAAITALLDECQNGDMIQVGMSYKDGNYDITEAITKSNMNHNIVILDEQWLRTGEMGGKDSLRAYHSTLNSIQSGAGWSYLEPTIRTYNDGESYFFLCKLTDAARDEFNAKHLEVKQFVENYTEFEWSFFGCGSCCPCTDQHHYSFSTLLRDLCTVGCMSCCCCMKDHDDVFILNPDDTGDQFLHVPDYKTQGFKKGANCCDKFVINCFLKMPRNTFQSTACVKFGAGIYQAGGLIDPNTVVEQITNEQLGWPDFWKGYWKVEVPPNVGLQARMNPYDEYINSFGVLNKEHFTKAMNEYFFDLKDYLEKYPDAAPDEPVDEEGAEDV